MSAECTYSRSGVIRRSRRDKNKAADAGQLSPESCTNRTSITPGTGCSSTSGTYCHLAADIEAAREKLSSLDTPQQRSSLDALSSLFQSFASMGMDSEAWSLDTAGKRFYVFKEHAIEWAEGTNLLNRNRYSF